MNLYDSETTPMGLVSLNCQYDASRYHRLATDFQNPAVRRGVVVLFDVAADPNTNSIHPGEPLFTDRQKGSDRDQHPIVFSAFNGTYVSNSELIRMTNGADDWQRGWYHIFKKIRFVGIAPKHTPYSPSTAGKQIDDGPTAQIAGLRDVINNGKHIIKQTQLVGVRPPSSRDFQKHARGITKEKFTGEFFPITPAHILPSATNVAAALDLFNQGTLKSFPIKKNFPEDQLATSLEEFIQHVVAMTVVALRCQEMAPLGAPIGADSIARFVTEACNVAGFTDFTHQADAAAGIPPALRPARTRDDYYNVSESTANAMRRPELKGVRLHKALAKLVIAPTPPKSLVGNVVEFKTTQLNGADVFLSKTADHVHVIMGCMAGRAESHAGPGEKFVLHLHSRNI